MSVYGKRGTLARYLVRKGLLAPLAKVRTACLNEIPVLAYHRVWDVADEAAFPFDLELVSASTAEFAWQMEQVAGSFTPITCTTLLRIISGRMPAPPRPILITFDDGYLDNYEHAFPLLQSRGISATFFLSTGYIGESRTFWYDQLAFEILQGGETVLALPELNLEVTLDAHRDHRRRELGRILKEMKRVPNAVRLQALERIHAEVGSAAGDVPLAMSGPMTWDHVREMAAAGMDFGSHSVTHPILSQLDDTDLWRELTESKQTLDEVLERSVEAISYPVGGLTAFDARVRHMSRSAGYKLGFSYIPGTNRFPLDDSFSLRRMHPERYTDHDYFTAMLQFPEVFR